MSSQSNKASYNIIIAIPVVLIVVGACLLTAAAAVENMHFISAVRQVMDLVSLTRATTADQKIISGSGEDIWADLAKAGRTPAQTTHPNPWGSDLRALSLDNMEMRIESDVPTNDCRRMAVYFMGQAQAFGLVGIEAQPFGDVIWNPIYPSPVPAHGHVVEAACGNIPYARLALIFKINM